MQSSRRQYIQALIPLLTLVALGACTPSAPPPTAPPPSAPSPSAATAALPRHAQSTFPPLPPAPEASSGFHASEPTTGKQFAAATAHPLATLAARDILREGGSAIDAAVAAQWVLNLVEPQSSGLGGGGLLLHWDGARVVALDGRETAPAAAPETLFLAGGKPLPFLEAVVGGRSVGTPGLLRLLESAHRRFGKLPWRHLATPALKLAREGIPVTPRLHRLLQGEDVRPLRRDPAAAAFFFSPQGTALAAGRKRSLPAFATLLERIATEGADAFYLGETPRAFAAAVQGHATNPGYLAASDLAQYQVVERTPLCFPYREWELCSFPPPSSGGLVLAQVFGMLEAKDLRRFPPVRRSFGHEASGDAVHWLTSALRIAFADRARYVADPAFVPQAAELWDALRSPAYLRDRARLLDEKLHEPILPGDPLGLGAKLADDASQERPSTTHLSIVDRDGHAVSLTSSIENAFGAQLMVQGVLLNNELTDFSFEPRHAGRPVANRLEPGKRPRSSMTPTFVFRRSDHRLVLVVGSPGGAAIISYVLETIVALLDWNLTPAEALALPRFVYRGGPTELEAGRVSSELRRDLEQRGHVVTTGPQTSGVHLLSALPPNETHWTAGADPRREGAGFAE